MTPMRVRKAILARQVYVAERPSYVWPWMAVMMWARAILRRGCAPILSKWMASRAMTATPARRQTPVRRTPARGQTLWFVPTQPCAMMWAPAILRRGCAPIRYRPTALCATTATPARRAKPVRRGNASTEHPSFVPRRTIVMMWGRAILRRARAPILKRRTGRRVPAGNAWPGCALRRR